MYFGLLPSSATVKIDNGENMENARYSMNDNRWFHKSNEKQNHK
jgi:hypothetical protein